MAVKEEEKHHVHHERLIRIFECSLQQEETGKDFFESSLQRMGWGAAVSAFKQLIKEEEHHIHSIGGILSNLSEGRWVALPLEKDGLLKPTDYFDERAKSEFAKGGITPLWRCFPCQTGGASGDLPNNLSFSLEQH